MNKHIDHIETIVIGAGVIGLAIARQLAMSGQDVVVLEAADAIGTVTSARNSEVIHAGIYYPTGSLKARLCVEGKELLYKYCDSHAIEHRRCGKLIVATSEAETKTLETVLAKAAANGLGDLTLLTRQQAIAMEPNLSCHAALFSPSTGIIDSHGYMLALQGDAEAAGAMIAFNTPVTGGKINTASDKNRFIIHTGDAAASSLSCSTLINAAGLGAQKISGKLKGLGAETIPELHYAKGNYYILAGAAPFSRLVYPVPIVGGLGVHSTIDMGKQTKFGPDVEWISEPDYEVDPRRGDQFYESIRRYWPELPDGALQAGYSGIRPKLTKSIPGVPDMDFMMQGPSQHGIPGLVNLYGIESPGLTSSLAIANYVASLL